MCNVQICPLPTCPFHGVSRCAISVTPKRCPVTVYPERCKCTLGLRVLEGLFKILFLFQGGSRQSGRSRTTLEPFETRGTWSVSLPQRTDEELCHKAAGFWLGTLGSRHSQNSPHRESHGAPGPLGTWKSSLSHPPPLAC